MEPQHECSICFEKFLLSSTLIVHKMQMHLSSSEGNASNKISTFLLDLFVEESLYCADEENEYTFTFITNVKQITKKDIKSENQELSPNDWVELVICKTDPLTDDNEAFEAVTIQPPEHSERMSPLSLKRKPSRTEQSWSCGTITTKPKVSDKSYSKCKRCGKIVLTHSLIEHLRNCLQSCSINPTLPSKAQHSFNCDKIDYHKCSVCDMKFAKKRALQIHQMSMHRPENETAISLISPGTTSKSCKCTLCNSEFADRKEIFSHLRLDHKSELKSIDLSANKCYACDVCPKTFKPFSRFGSHSRNAHFKKLTQLCSICGKGYVNVTRLRTHMRSVHTGERPYECFDCKKRFTEKRTLADHLGLHSGDRPYVCLAIECLGRAYAQKSGLRQHQILAHKGEGRYQCHVCDKRFTLRRFHT